MPLVGPRRAVDVYRVETKDVVREVDRVNGGHHSRTTWVACPTPPAVSKVVGRVQVTQGRHRRHYPTDLT